MDRAIDRAIQDALSSPETERRVNEVLDSELVDRVWERLLASDEVQKLVERIAEAPEVRAAITQQGLGLLDDVGRGIAEVARRIDDALERVARRLLRRPQRTERSQNAGIFARLLSVAIDLAILNGIAYVVSALGATLLSGVIDSPDGLLIALGATIWAAAEVTYLLIFWTLAGQTPGMRFLGLQLRSGDELKLTLRQGVRRIWGIVVSLLALGLGFLSILINNERRGWHDRMAGTEVFFENLDRSAPWSGGLEKKPVQKATT